MAHIDNVTVKGKPYYRLVESYRDVEGRPRYRVLRYIGNEAAAAKFRAALKEAQRIGSLLEDRPDLVTAFSSAARQRLFSAARNEKIERVPTPIPESDVYYADPPWKYDFAETISREVENQYPTMGLEAIKNLGNLIPSPPNCALFLWATAPKLIEALEVMKAWGFEYKTNAVWDKEQIGMGYWFRGQHELLLVGTKGVFSPPVAEARVSSVIREKRTGHSVKPAEVPDLIERMFPAMRLCELFCRERHSERWRVWGFEVGE